MTKGGFLCSRSASGGMLRSHSFPGVTALARFDPSQIEVSMKGVEGCRGKFVSPFLEFGRCPIPIQSNDVLAKIFGEGQSVFAFANENVANPASGRTVVHVAARLSLVVEIDQEHFPVILEARPIIPGLA